MKNFLFTLIFCLFGLLNCFSSPIKSIELNFPNKPYIYSLTNTGDSILINNNKYLPIYRYLELKNDQKDMFFEIHENLLKSLDYLSMNKENGIKEFKMHLYHELRLSKMILEDDQYRKYLRTLNVTLNNKDLMKYIILDYVSSNNSNSIEKN